MLRGQQRGRSATQLYQRRVETTQFSDLNREASVNGDLDGWQGAGPRLPSSNEDFATGKNRKRAILDDAFSANDALEVDRSARPRQRVGGPSQAQESWKAVFAPVYRYFKARLCRGRREIAIPSVLPAQQGRPAGLGRWGPPL